MEYFEPHGLFTGLLDVVFREAAQGCKRFHLRVDRHEGHGGQHDGEPKKLEAGAGDQAWSVVLAQGVGGGDGGEGGLVVSLSLCCGILNS